MPCTVTQTPFLALNRFGEEYDLSALTPLHQFEVQTATASQTSFTLAKTPVFGATGKVRVSRNGVDITRAFTWVGGGTNLITATLGFVPSVGWQVDLPDALPAGTHTFLKYSGTATTILPTVGTNLSGRTVTGFAYNNTANPKTLSVTLA